MSDKVVQVPAPPAPHVKGQYLATGLVPKGQGDTQGVYKPLPQVTSANKRKLAGGQAGLRHDAAILLPASLPASPEAINLKPIPVSGVTLGENSLPENAVESALPIKAAAPISNELKWAVGLPLPASPLPAPINQQGSIPGTPGNVPEPHGSPIEGQNNSLSAQAPVA